MRNLIKKMLDLYKEPKYKSIVNYIFFGVCTTLVNVVTYFILYLFTVVTFFLSWHSLTLNNVLEVILQTVLIIPTLYTLFVPHNEVIKKVNEFLSAKKE